MKYFYIICLALSSFFANKNAIATQLQYAFFIPNNTFQQNTSVQELDNIHPRYSKQLVDNYDEDEDIISDEEIDLYYPKQDSFKKPSQHKSEPQISRPYVRKEVVLDDSIDYSKLKNTAENYNKQENTSKKNNKQPNKHLNEHKAGRDYHTPPPPPPPHIATKQPQPPVMDEGIEEKLNKYSLDDNFGDSPKGGIFKISSTENFKQLSLPDMLSTIPYPDENLPKFQQCYATYGMDLRVLYRRGELPRNYDQEEVLAKANSSTRFEVK